MVHMLNSGDACTQYSIVTKAAEKFHLSDFVLNVESPPNLACRRTIVAEN